MDALEGLRLALGDRYTIDREIGHGGTATVFLAHDVKHRRSVAIKVLAPELALTVRSERFLREIQIAARLQHPHILPLHESGQANGLLYYVMPYVSGETLRERLARERRLPYPDAVRITQQVASALTYAHEEGVVHRDIKPGNILLSAGEAIVADFGIARAMKAAEAEGAQDSVTETGISVGTPAYMSPEQAGGESNLDGRTDIYSLGCVLYEMLAGCPPFQGPTVHAVIAQHLVDRPPSLRRSRADVPAGMDRVLERALAKDPTERFRTAKEFSDAVAAPDAMPRAPWSGKKKARIALGVSLAIATVAGWQVASSRSLSLGANKIVVFPLVERGVSRAEQGVGERVALMIGSALERTEPLKWIDGWTWLRPPERTDVTRLSATGARDIARARGARYYIDGSVVRGTDSTTVILHLNDAAGDSMIAQVSASGAGAETAAQLGLDGVTQLLPRVLEPGRKVDLSALAARRPAAIANWLQGEREYRRSRFPSALGFYRQAIAQDSALAVAALKGAQAAGWQNLDSQAVYLVGIALAHAALLPSKQRDFALGLNAYYHGEADSAVDHLRHAIADDSEWAEAYMAMGEVLHHLLPRTAEPLDSLAQAAFYRAAELDTGFAPPLYHLTELAIRSGDLNQAGKLLSRFERFEPDSNRRRQLRLMYSCAAGRPGTTAWMDVARVAPMDVWQAARSLGAGGQEPRCAEEALRALLSTPDLRSYHWGAFRVLHGLLVSEERYAEIARLTDSMSQAGFPGAADLYFIDVFAGAPFDNQARAEAAALRREFGDRLKGVSFQGRWLVAAWYAHHGDSSAARLIAAGLLSEPLASTFPVSQALSGHFAWARGDTAGALRYFGSLDANVPRDNLEWGSAEPLAIERFAMAEMALARHQFAQAGRLASVFDHEGPIVFLPFTAGSLRIRLLAARAGRNSEAATLYQQRLQRLKHASELSANLY